MRSSIWKGSISFGLLNIPVSLQSAEENRSLHFSMLDGKDFAPIKYKKINSVTGKEVPYDRIVKGYKYESGQYVIVTDEDFKAANAKATQAIDIEDFVLVEEIDPMLFEKPYYLVPQKNAEKGYFLLRDALAREDKVAVGRIVIRTKQHLALIMARGEYLVLELLRFPHQVKEIGEVDYLDEVNLDVKYSKRELEIAEELIDSMTTKWAPRKYEDTYYDDLMKTIKYKIKTGKSIEVQEPDESEVAPTRNVVDLLPLLQKSLQSNRKKPKTARGEKSPSRSERSL